MQGTRSNYSSVFLVINMEIVETTTSFLTFLGTCLYSDPFDDRCNIQYGLGPLALYLYPSLLP